MALPRPLVGIRVRRSSAAVAVVGTLLISACTSGNNTDSPPTSSTATGSPPAEAVTAEPRPEPEPTARLEWVFTQDDLVRFVARIDNPSSRTRVGVRTEWVAVDQTGAIVASFSGERPAIPAGDTVWYVGGAGTANLSGAPHDVMLELVDRGTPTDAVPAASLTVDDVMLEAQPGGSFGDAPFAYRVTATVTAPDQPIDKFDVDVFVVLLDDAGNVVGGDFTDLESAPSTIPAGARVRMQAEFVDATSEATSAQVFVYRR